MNGKSLTYKMLAGPGAIFKGPGTVFKLCCVLSFLALSNPLPAKQWLVFYAKEGFFNGVIRQSFGHIFIGLVQEDPDQPKNLLAGFWGYYPKDGIKPEGWWGYMDGSIRNDWAADYQHCFAVEISTRDFDYCLQQVKDWNHKPYSIRMRNCISFVRNLVKNMPHIKGPEGFYVLPSAYIRDLQSENRNIIYKGHFENYKTVTHITHYDGKLAKKFFVLDKWKKYFQKFKRSKKNKTATDQ